MTTRWLAMLLLVALAGPALAQDRPSHRPVNTGLADDRSPEQRLADRLRSTRERERNEDEKRLSEEMKGLAEKILKDPELRKSLLKKLDDRQLKDLQQRLQQEGGNLNDPQLRRLFEESMKSNDFKLDERDRQLLQRWQEKLREKGIGSNSGGNPPIPPPPPVDPGKPQVPPPPPPGSTEPWKPPTGSSTPDSWGDLANDPPDWLKKGLGRTVDDVSKWLDTPSGKSWSKTIAEAAGRAASNTRSTARASSGRLRGLGGYLPNVRSWLPRRSPNLPNARLPGVPRVGGRMPAAPSLSGRDAGKVVLVVALVAVLALVLWYSRGWWQGALSARLAAWKLGPWPVRPQDVSTRGELVRAFEHLALLCLGPAARTCHHLELARQIGGLPSVDPDRRRDAAADLALVYEQARYTPDDELLPDELMSRARRDLCYLAGEPTA